MTDHEAQLDRVYASAWHEAYEAGNSSRAPRSSDLLYETVRELGLTEQSVLVDAGCRDAAHAIRLVTEHGCSAIAFDLLPDLVEDARAAVQAAGLSDRVCVREGSVERIDLPDDGVDAIWFRDVMSLVADAPAALSEFHRILRPDGWLLVYSTVATARLAAEEAAELYPHHGIVEANMDQARVEGWFAAAGFGIARRDVIGSEWREWGEEHGNPEFPVAADMLRIARLLRDRDAFVERFGAANTDVALAASLWGPYQLLGKLQPTLWVLRPTGGECAAPCRPRALALREPSLRGTGVAV